MATNASKAQLGRLMTVYNQLAGREIGMNTSRDARMAWASKLLQREVTSFSNLSVGDAGFLIDQAQGELGFVAPLKKVRSRKDAQRAGVDGRNCSSAEEFAGNPEMVSTETMQMIGGMYERLSFTEASFRHFLKTAKRSPLRGRTAIRTTAEANKVIFMLKGMLRARGLWNEVAA